MVVHDMLQLECSDTLCMCEIEAALFSSSFLFIFLFLSCYDHITFNIIMYIYNYMEKQETNHDHLQQEICFDE